ncbi:putative Multidrug Resistance Associated Protein (MRP) [Monocercomonoides exilis]|uniref:putative Multidrug Resistance Associated Protein (MRP) n=1 Tax=Monocercomonoides exilis TaxID=2049356 RepID=UPI0035598A9F|nr:putative Multidrug Resistance Associated Protein (MRP) [Monocercomonoides exilis]|eukprot:MONOS_7842.1-p1 / transcript=MONOS_7842.1 / gene=MONOS_7842 / organism=Monocercomonoides_exilis_PA203 / gene_product=Multidrug Resistance Associated Protein (MRP) / transcript_product=Multidrug Resistance Associated Protein (MRP) / location=Mono_scaffold00279:50445-54802(+) / protein_length=1429 / sequence_SO=supercontig / SO=protein_coding / is_pseudo=false
MMKEVLKAVTLKGIYDSTNGMMGSNTFPYASGIILMLCPILNALLDGCGFRMLYHFAAQIRAAFTGAIYDKTLLLNITAQSNIDTGRLLTLISADARNVAEMIPMFLMMLWIPIQILVPFGFLIADFGASTLIALAVIVVLLPFEILCVSVMMTRMKSYLNLNDARTKITNETLQGMRVVKYTGLEEAFIAKINEPRKKQIDAAKSMTTIMQIMNAIMRVTPQLVNLATFSVYIFTNNITQDMFAVYVMANLGFLTLMTQPMTMLPIIFQGIGLINVSITRIRDFLILPELKIEKRDKPNDPEVALLIENGTFKWGEPPEIPLSMSEKAALKKKMAEKKKEDAQRQRDKNNNTIETNETSQQPNATIVSESSGSSSSSTTTTTPSCPTPTYASVVDAGTQSSSSSKSLVPSTTQSDAVCSSAPVFAETAAEGPANAPPPADTTPKQISPATTESSESAQLSMESATSTTADAPKEQKVSVFVPTPTTASCDGVSSTSATPALPHSVFSTTPTPIFSRTPFSSASPSPSPTPSESPSGSNRNEPVLRDVNLVMKKGTLTMVVGGVGSGKSSLGAAIIADAEKVSGKVEVDGQVSYCAQTAWINNNTVRGNITFGCPFEQEKYSETIRVCALENDLKLLAAGDQTEIGEKGVNLSGGQKARIQLARAVYSDRDIYILDDPLSAVDAHVGRYLFDECIIGTLKNRGKTVLLMTNQLQYLDRADNIILLGGGRIAAQGTEKELRDQGIDFSEYIIRSSHSDEDDDEEENGEGKDGHHHHHHHKKGGKAAMMSKKKREEMARGKAGNKEDENEEGSEAGKHMMTEEEQETGSVPLKIYVQYFLSLLPGWALVPFLLLMLLSDAVMSMGSYWVGVIGTATQYPSISYEWKIGIYGFIALAVLVLLLIRAAVVRPMSARSNRLIHSELLLNVMHCPSSFFDTTPMGRILNRFTGDIPQVDQQLLSQLLQVLSMWLGLIGQVVIVAVDTVFFLAIGLPALVVYYIILQIYSNASRNLQRLESMSRSPVLSLFSETVSGAGLSTIRSYHLEETWRQRFYALNDEWNVRFVLFREGQKWATLFSSLLSTILMVGIILLGWFYMEPAKLGVAVSSGIIFCMLGQQIVQQNVELDSRMTGYQRIKFYSSQLPQEKDHTKKEGAIDPPKEWPEEGKVEYDHVTFRYRPGLPFVLRDVSFSLKAGEKIGVCGRTGAGKSSLLFALFRLVELDPSLQPTMIDVNTGFPIEADPNEVPNSGRVLIDGVDISKVNLGRVRRSIAIIPQDPTLFTGTLRYNLDIGSKCSDDEIWEVLELIEMKDIVAGLEYGLDTQMAEGGSNFSAGQRQLICFGRAMLNKCKIVIMDEATANVDVETDAKIQNTIRRVFSKQTVIVIAHRLNTIMNSDRILVMNQGQVQEMDSPANLLANPDSAFNALIQSLNGA